MAYYRDREARDMKTNKETLLKQLEDRINSGLREQGVADVVAEFWLNGHRRFKQERVYLNSASKKQPLGFIEDWGGSLSVVGVKDDALRGVVTNILGIS